MSSSKVIWLNKIKIKIIFIVQPIEYTYCFLALDILGL